LYSERQFFCGQSSYLPLRWRLRKRQVRLDTGVCSSPGDRMELRRLTSDIDRDDVWHTGSATVEWYAHTTCAGTPVFKKPLTVYQIEVSARADPAHCRTAGRRELVDVSQCRESRTLHVVEIRGCVRLGHSMFENSFARRPNIVNR